MPSDNEFDISSGEEEALLDVTGEKRSRSLSGNGDNRPVKRSNTMPGTLGTIGFLAHQILKDNFGLNSFRLKQEAAIKHLLAGNSAVVVFPTGGGKSLCFQGNALGLSSCLMFT